MGAKDPGAYVGGQPRMKNSGGGPGSRDQEGATWGSDVPGRVERVPSEVLLTRVSLQQDVGARP